MTSRIVFASAVILCLVTPLVVAQEFVQDERIKVSNDSPSEPVPVVVFNGTEHGVFFFWAGSQDEDSGLHFRRLDRDGNTVGAQKLVTELEFGGALSNPISAVWDGEAYVVAAAGYREGGLFIKAEPAASLKDKGYLFRVSRTGVLLAEQSFDLEQSEESYAALAVGRHSLRSGATPQLFVIGDRVFLFYDLRKILGGASSYMVMTDRLLQGELTKKKLPKGDLRYAQLVGASHDADKFVVLLAEVAISPSWEFEYRATHLLHVNFKGNVIDTPLPAPGRVVTATSKTFLADAYEVAGPVFDGKEFFLVATRIPPPRFRFLSQANIQYTNQSIKINDRGEIVAGPFDLGSSFMYYTGLSNPFLAGNHFSTLVFDYMTWGNAAILAGKNGRHLTNLYYDEGWFLFIGGYESSQAYTGTANTIVFLGNNDRLGWGRGMNVYTRQYSMPDYSKPGFFYFLAGESEPEKNKRLVMWSAVLCTNVKLSGPDFEMDNLPPVWSYLVDTKGEKTKLTLTLTLEDGSTKTRKLTINP